MKRVIPVQIYHYWHPDVGYRKAKINNTVFRELDPTRYPVIICLDHDVILHPRFVEDHYQAHLKENFAPLLFMGRRIDLSDSVSETITPENVKSFIQGLNFKLVRSGLKGETRKRHALGSVVGATLVNSCFKARPRLRLIRLELLDFNPHDARSKWL